MQHDFAITRDLKAYLQNAGDEYDVASQAELPRMIYFYIDQLRKLNPIHSPASFRQIHQKVDELISGLPGNRKVRIRCKKGCSFCCHYNVEIYRGEAMLIAEYCAQKGISIDKEYLLQQLRSKPLDLPLRRSHSACVFLKDGECSIYEVRPIACRNYFVINDPKYCDAYTYPYPSKLTQGIFNWDVELYLSALITVTQDGDRLPRLLLQHT